MNRRSFNKTAAMVIGIGAASSLLGQEKKIRIGQIGTAHAHAAGKMAALRKFPETFELIGIAEPDARLWQESRGRKVYAGLEHMSVEQMLSQKSLDAVVIETTVPDLLPTAKKALAAGKHIHLDKPPGNSLEQFREVVELARTNNLVLQMGYMFRYNPAFLFAREVVKKGWLGDLFEIDGVISKVLNPTSRAKEGPEHGGSMMLLGCHLIDMLIAFMGKPDRVAPYRRQTLPQVDTLYDNELAVFEYLNAICTIRSALVEVEGWERRQFVICGTQGTIEIKPIEDPALKLSLDRPRGKFKKGSQFVELENNGDRYDAQLMDFAKMIRGVKKPDYGFDHDLITQESVLRAASII